MAYIETDTPSGVMGFDIKDDFAFVSGIRGRDVELIVPDNIMYKGKSCPVTGIGRKAFLSDRYLYDLVLPEGVTHIDDWAFAGCRNLKSITMGRSAVLGNGVFKDCKSLERVVIHTAISEDASYLLAAVIKLMDDRFLFDPANAGTPEWYANWDRRMAVIVNEPDEEGFGALLACGEEDYEGRDNTIESYLARRKRRKARVCMMRLLHDEMLDDDNRKLISDYLYDHRAGTESPAFWEVILKEHGDDEAYYALMCDLGCVDASNTDIILNDLGQSHPGMKSYLIRYRGGSPEGGFLDGLNL